MEVSNMKKLVAKSILWFILILVGLSTLGLLIKFILFPFFVADKASEAAHDVVEKTLDADNVLHNYEMFKDLYNGAKQQAMNIQNSETAIQTLKDTYGEASTWTEDIRDEYNFQAQTLESYKQQYQRTVSDYNSNASKLNRNLFKDKNLPEELPLYHKQLQ
jgi:gas vesicle protein